MSAPGTDIVPDNKKLMEHQLKQGSFIEHDNKKWKITEISEDNEGQIVYHLKSGEDVSVIKESDLPKDPGILRTQKARQK